MAKILLVDDDEDLLDMVTFMLRANRYEVTALNDGSGIPDCLSVNKPDMIIMDIYLGTMDGRTLSKNIKSSHDMPVLLYSAGNIPPATITDSMADAFVQKPFDMRHLVSTIESILAKRKA